MTALKIPRLALIAMAIIALPSPHTPGDSCFKAGRLADCPTRNGASAPLDAAPDRGPLVGVDRPPGEHGVDRRPDVSGRHR
jgi:hypothetical protein